ncbi:hypothetical protein BDB01DRAFT_179881 [Pilobolus umbonatus]|nr:hypothetical protein BDB01DRAFT_179881 [Pilobolus umbonatus]
MAPHKRGRHTGTRRKQRQTRRSQSTSDESSSDTSSITRCVCGETYNVGLMVQCDKCEVWQHCECMGLEEPDIPDHYYCEECKPENHSMNRQMNGRVKRQYDASGHSTSNDKKAPKKRMTLNSREASMSIEDVLAARTVLELYENNQEEDINYDQVLKEIKVISTDNPLHTKRRHRAEDEESIPSKKRRELEKKLPDVEEKSEPPSPTISPVNDESPVKEKDESIAMNKVTKSRRRNNKQTKEKAEKKKNGKMSRQNMLRKNKPRSRTSTPQPSDSPTSVDDVYCKEKCDNDANLSISFFDHFTPQSRAASPPAKTRYPHSRMSISEMNRRANQILEYISSIQVAMATKESDMNNEMEDEQEFFTYHSGNGHGNLPPSLIIPDTRDREHSPSSMSSASTIPLEDDYEKSVAEEVIENTHKQSSLEIMDALTRKLIKFQRRFGPRNKSAYEEVMEEGRMTRSREINSNTNVYPNMITH